MEGARTSNGRAHALEREHARAHAPVSALPSPPLPPSPHPGARKWEGAGPLQTGEGAPVACHHPLPRLARRGEAQRAAREWEAAGPHYFARCPWAPSLLLASPTTPSRRLPAPTLRHQPCMHAHTPPRRTHAPLRADPQARLTHAGRAGRGHVRVRGGARAAAQGCRLKKKVHSLCNFY